MTARKRGIQKAAARLVKRFQPERELVLFDAESLQHAQQRAKSMREEAQRLEEWLGRLIAFAREQSDL